MSQEKIYSGVEVFILRDGKVALGKRKNAAGEGEYGLPGGHLEEGEKLVDTAIRELKEETGIDVTEKDLELVCVVDDLRQEKHYVHIAFELKDFQGDLELCEPDKCEGWEWFDLDDLPEVFYGHTRIFETYLEKKLYLY